ncbi:MAG: MATE family efflux transporter [Clostridia bacterium]|nr:MATE family efflux transporter [Clostridia bacterium]
MEEKRKPAGLDTERIIPTYFHLALPVVVGSIITIIYNLADTYFIAQTNNAKLVAGVSVCSPLFMILMAFGNIYGQGGSSLISRLLGKQATEDVGRVSAFCFYAALATGAVIGGLMFLFRSPLLKLLGASPETLPYAREYGTVLMLGGPLIVVNFIHMNLLRCEGMSGLSMCGTAIGAVVNVILDPLMIRSMGAAGAAAATVIGYLCSDLFLLTIVLRKSSCLSIAPSVRITSAQIRNIIAIGITAAITNLASSLCVMMINQQLLPYGDDKIASMGIVLKVAMIVNMIMVGFAFGGIPLFGFLIGSGQKEKLKQLLRFCLGFLCVLALSVSAVVILSARPLLSLITPDAGLTETAVPMLRWQTAGCVFGGIVMLLTCLFQASGKALPAMALSLSRQGIVFILVLLTAVRIAGYQGILLSQFASDVLSAALALTLYAAVGKK